MVLEVYMIVSCLSFWRGLDLLQDGENCSTATGLEDTVSDTNQEREPATVDELYDLKHYDSGEEDGEAMWISYM